MTKPAFITQLNQYLEKSGREEEKTKAGETIAQFEVIFLCFGMSNNENL